MKKNTLFSLVAMLSVTGISVLSGVTQVRADELSPTQHISNVTIGFTDSNSGNVEPGKLSLRFTPSSLYFGTENAVSAEKAEYVRLNSKNEAFGTDYIIVTDTRSADETIENTNFWKLGAQLSTFEGKEDKSKRLVGAAIKFKTEAPFGYTGTQAPSDALGNVSNDSAGRKAQVDSEAATIETKGIRAGDSVALALAYDGSEAEGTYQGDTAIRISEMSLVVPAGVNEGNKGETYTSTLTWSLNSTL